MTPIRHDNDGKSIMTEFVLLFFDLSITPLVVVAFYTLLFYEYNVLL